MITKGIKYSEKEDYEMARRCCYDAMPWAVRSSQPDAVAWCYNNIGYAYLMEGNYDSASAYLYTSLKVLQKRTTAPTHSGANIYNNLGTVNMRLGQPAKALEFYNKAEDVALRGNLSFQLAEAKVNKGNYYNAAHRPDSMIKYFNEVMDIGRKIGKEDLQATANIGLGKAYTAQGHYAAAVTCLQKAIGLAQGQYYNIVTDASYALGNTYLSMHNYADAQTVLNAALREARAHNIKDSYIDGYARWLPCTAPRAGMPKRCNVQIA